MTAPTASAIGLSDEHKDAVKKWIVKLRSAIEDDFEAQLHRFGFRRDGRHAPEINLALPESELRIRRHLAALIEHDTAGEGSHKRGFAAVIRELTYTLINRLVGLKVMEARRLLWLHPPENADAEPERTEVVTPVEGQDRSRFLRDFRAAAGNRYKYEADADEALFRDGLTAAFIQLHDDLGPLFAPDHDYACLWPTHAALSHALRLINADLPFDAYRAPDFLGWVYQFFNRDEKDRVRAENKGTPRSSYELSVINQFYTPSWVVKALVDNTLGRLWLQMHPESVLAPSGPVPLPQDRSPDLIAADYLVPRTGEKIHYRYLDEAGNPHAFKPVREIRFLDPACGTMHFGQYAFGLFYRMYEEEIAHAGQPGWPAHPSVSDARDIPAAIIEHNLYGIDIDPRAIQIASLSLLFTAKEAAVRAGHSPTIVHVRPRNLVVAHAVRLDEAQLRSLVERAGQSLGQPNFREKLFDELWRNLRHVGELGSLMQVEEGVSRVLQEWVDTQARKRGLTKLFRTHKSEQMELGGIDIEARQDAAQQLELERSMLESEAIRIRAELLSGLESVAASEVNDPRQRLFAEDTARGLRLLELLAQYYDVIVMNPPYGSFPKLNDPKTDKKFKDELRKMYPCGYQDIYSAFIERATQLIEPEGYIGALVNSTFKTNLGHAKFRREILLKRHPLVLMLDLGFGILDGATVEAAALVLRGIAP